MIASIQKRDNTVVPFQKEKITWAIYKAAAAVGGDDWDRAEKLTNITVAVINDKFNDPVAVEDVQDTVEKVLIEQGHAKTAKAYILYREKRRIAREANSLVDATINMFEAYLSDTDWKIQENANTQKSINGMNNYIRETFTRAYWLNEVYSKEIRDAHTSGDLHIHDLGFFGPYCAGWDLYQLLNIGFGGVGGKVTSKPAKHLRAFLGQVVNSTFTTQGECAGAQAWSSFDVYCAPFVRYDKLDYKSVKQAMQEFVFNLNVPTRVGFQCPFSNITLDITIPETLKNRPVVVGGVQTGDMYGDFQSECDMINRAFCDVMLEGDAQGRVFTFPIPTINVTKNFNWDSPVVDEYMKITAKYGIPYFSNYVNSDLSPEDALSMCCRLRLDTSELRKRGGGLFGSNPLTGSLGVVTINLPRIAYLSTSESEFRGRLWKAIDIAKNSLEIKRKTIEAQTKQGLYPYSKRYLEDVYSRTGKYWNNHFSTVGLVGMHEACLNLLGEGIETPEGQEFAVRTLEYMRDLITRIQADTGNVYNLEATPAEGTSYSLARLDKKRWPDIITSGVETPYYTNSSQLPVNYTDDIFEALDLQDRLQTLYTGGTVQHLYLGEEISDYKNAGELIRTIFNNYKLPYISLTPTFSICPEHGYRAGEHFKCDICGKDAEVWSRVVGYLRPVQNFNIGKKEEYRERKVYTTKQAV